MLAHGTYSSALSHKSYLKKKEIVFWVLSFCVLVEWIVLAFNVMDRPTWFVENIIPVVLACPGIWLFRKGVLSGTSMVILYVYVALHLVGAHYTYSLVPYDRVLESLFGVGLNTIMGWDRNQYDRIVHFSFGLMLYQPVVEILRYYTPSIRGWALPTFVILLLNMFSVGYEWIEWAASLMLNERTGLEFLGSQGDIWDAHKDMMLAFVGSLLAAMIFNGFFAKAKDRIRENFRRHRDMRPHFKKNFGIKRRRRKEGFSN